MSDLILLLIVTVPIFIMGWWRQLKTHNAGWVDVLWAFSVAGGGIFYATTGTGELKLRIVVGLMYALWFLRLGVHLFKRIRQDSTEDGRYRYMRQWAADKAPLIFFVFYLVQASWVWLFTLPAWLLSQGQWPGVWATILAILIALCAFAGEALADRQLQRFKQHNDNHQAVCQKGLWRYSRHPNYFFEWCHWFSYPILALNTPYGGWLWSAPVVMFLFLYFFTGIPFTEQQALRRRGENYRRYQKTTSMFFPWPPKQP